MKIFEIFAAKLLAVEIVAGIYSPFFNVTNKSLQDAKTLLKNLGFTVHLNGVEDLSALVTSQNPKPGVLLLKNADVYLYSNTSR